MIISVCLLGNLLMYSLIGIYTFFGVSSGFANPRNRPTESLRECGFGFLIERRSRNTLIVGALLGFRGRRFYPVPALDFGQHLNALIAGSQEAPCHRQLQPVVDLALHPTCASLQVESLAQTWSSFRPYAPSSMKIPTTKRKRERSSLLALLKYRRHRPVQRVVR